MAGGVARVEIRRPAPDTIGGVAEIMVLAAGSTGDVEPFAALAARLAERGQEVALAADAGHERLAPGGGVEFAPIRADFRSLLPAPDRKRPSLRGEVFPVVRGMLEDSWRVARDTQPKLLVAHQKTLAAPHVAEKLGIPHIQALTVPMLTPTREFPLPAIVAATSADSSTLRATGSSASSRVPTPA
jgi:sterol 3beta-glucosyltransferase